MKKLALILALLPLTVVAEPKTKGGYFACNTKKQITEYHNYIIKKDDRGLQHLLKNGCVNIPAGIPISVIDRGFLTSKLRFYYGGKSFELWSPSEIIGN